jgi:ABC-type uncharacterized transport system permease subunit
MAHSVVEALRLILWNFVNENEIKTRNGGRAPAQVTRRIDEPLALVIISYLGHQALLLLMHILVTTVTEKTKIGTETGTVTQKARSANSDTIRTSRTTTMSNLCLRQGCTGASLPCMVCFRIGAGVHIQ